MPSRADEWGKAVSGAAGQSFLERVRGHDFSGHSDADLRDALALPAPEETAPVVFAVVAEAIDRRLGAWRIFDAPPDASLPPAIAEAAARVSEERKYRRPADIRLPASFYRAVRALEPGLGFRFRVANQQILAGYFMLRGRVVQMNAGEGKTAAAAFPAVLHALAGRPVHVFTANDYLADRDAALLAPVYESLGISAGALLSHMDDDERKHVYRRRIVYGTMREFGFDYLRDNLKMSNSARVQGRRDAAIVDEADHALIDEAFTPMIISGAPSGSPPPARRVRDAVTALIEAQSSIAGDLAASLDAGEPGNLRLAARLTLAQPEHPALQRFLSSHPRQARRIRALAGQEHTGMAHGLLYAIDPDLRYVTLTDDGWRFLEKRLGPLDCAPLPGAGFHSDGASLAERRRREARASRRLSHRSASPTTSTSPSAPSCSSGAAWTTWWKTAPSSS